jgi:predicted histone-like DNA-binding protein
MLPKLKAVLRLDPRDRTKPGKYYPSIKSNGIIDLRQLMRDITDMTSLSTSDVRAMLEALIYLIPKHLMRGAKVRLGDFGLFHLTIHGEGKDTEEEVDSRAVKKKMIRFLPGIILKEAIAMMKFEKEE